MENNMREKNDRAKSWAQIFLSRVSRPQDFARPYFPRGLFTLSVDGLGRRGTTCSLQTSRFTEFAVVVYLLSRTSILKSRKCFISPLMSNKQFVYDDNTSIHLPVRKCCKKKTILKFKDG